MTTVAFREPRAVGRARTPIEHETPVARCAPVHEFETTEKSLGFAPASETPAIASVPEPALGTVRAGAAVDVEPLSQVTVSVGSGLPLYDQLDVNPSSWAAVSSCVRRRKPSEPTSPET